MAKQLIGFHRKETTMKLSSEGFFTKWDQIITDVVTSTEETLTEKFRFLRSV